MANENLNVAIFNLANNLGFLLQGVLFVLGFLYFYRYRKTDGIALRIAVGLCLILETIATGFNISYAWKTANGIGISSVHWEPPFSMVVRLPVVVISQTFFFYRAWRLFSRPTWILFVWAIAILAELAVGEANFLVTVFQRTVNNTKPISTVDLLTSHLAIVLAVDCITATCFIWKLTSLKSSIKRSDEVIKQIVFQTVVSNICFSALSLTVLLTWILVLSAKWYKIPMELGYRSYAIFFLTALLTRESVRNQLNQPLRSLQFPIDLNSEQSNRVQHRDANPSHLPSFVDKSLHFPTSPSPPPWSSGGNGNRQLKSPQKPSLEGFESRLKDPIISSPNQPAQINQNENRNMSIVFRNSRRRTLSSSASLDLDLDRSYDRRSFLFNDLKSISSLPPSDNQIVEKEVERKNSNRSSSTRDSLTNSSLKIKTKPKSKSDLNPD